MKKLSHLDDRGEVKMVDVGCKAETRRTARAEGKVLASKKVMEAVRKNGLPKGNLFTTAKIAGIQGGKMTSALVPLCHPLPLDNIKIDISTEGDSQFIVRAEASCTGRTGVEMEALTAAAIACLTIYDMCKAIDKGMTITDIQLIEKTGGKSGHYKRK